MKKKPSQHQSKSTQKLSFTDDEEENDDTNENGDVPSETEEEVVESEDDEEDEDEEDESEEADEKRLVDLWKWLSPPTKEEIFGKWFAFIYETKKHSHLYIVKAVTRFLQDADGSINSLMLDCLKPCVGTGTELESYNGDAKDVAPVKEDNIIYGSIKVTPMKGNKWDVPNYGKIEELFKS